MKNNIEGKNMDVRRLKNGIIFVVLIAYIFLYKLLIFPNFMKYSEIVSAAFMVVLLALSIKFLGFRRDKTTVLTKTVLRVVIFYLVLAFFIMYGLGIVVGFLRNAYSRNILTLFDNIFAPIIMIVLIELFRYVVVWANKDRKNVLMFITLLLTIFELCISIRTINLGDLQETFNTFATIMLPVTIKNIIMSYFCYHVGYRIPLVYRLVMDIYVFVVPFVPNLGEYLTSMILVSLPILIYISCFGMVDSRVTKPEPVFYNKDFTLLDGFATAFLLALIALISGFFPHFMIGVGSSSMEPVISKGDAVILKKVSSKVNLKKNDIIAYGKDKVIVVHRIVEVHKDENGVVTYVTKGDANNGNDSREVQKSQVKGVVKVKIPFIAYPTVWLSELFNKR